MESATVLAVEVEIFSSGNAEYRVIDRPSKAIFGIVRAARDEPLELLAECPYTYNRETVRARAIRVAQMLRDEEMTAEENGMML